MVFRFPFAHIPSRLAENRRRGHNVDPVNLRQIRSVLVKLALQPIDEPSEFAALRRWDFYPIFEYRSKPEWLSAAWWRPKFATVFPKTQTSHRLRAAG